MRNILFVAVLMAALSGLARANDDALEPIVLSEPLVVSETGCGPVEPLPATAVVPKAVCPGEPVCEKTPVCAPKKKKVVCAPAPEPVCAPVPEPACASLRPAAEPVCAPDASGPAVVAVAAAPSRQPVVVAPVEEPLVMVPVKKKVWVEEEYTVEETRTAYQEELRTKVIKPKAPRLAKVKSVYGASLIVHKDKPREKTYTKKVKVKYTEPVTKTRKVAKEIEEYQMVPQRRARR